MKLTGNLYGINDRIQQNPIASMLDDLARSLVVMDIGKAIFSEDGWVHTPTAI